MTSRFDALDLGLADEICKTLGKRTLHLAVAFFRRPARARGGRLQSGARIELDDRHPGKSFQMLTKSHRDILPLPLRPSPDY